MGMDSKQVEILEEKAEYEGFFSLTSYRLRHTLYQGGWSEVIRRELFHRSRCVGVVLYDPELDRVVLIEQFRIGAVKSKEVPWLIEIVAGAIEEGESPESVAIRESEEEAGCSPRELIRIGEFFTTPGANSERLVLFCGLVDSKGVGGIYGLPEEHEDIRVFVVDFDEAFSWVESGVIDSAIPIIGLQWLAMNRKRFRPD